MRPLSKYLACAVTAGVGMVFAVSGVAGADCLTPTYSAATAVGVPQEVTATAAEQSTSGTAVTATVAVPVGDFLVVSANNGNGVVTFSDSGGNLFNGGSTSAATTNGCANGALLFCSGWAEIQTADTTVTATWATAATNRQLDVLVFSGVAPGAVDVVTQAYTSSGVTLVTPTAPVLTPHGTGEELVQLCMESTNSTVVPALRFLGAYGGVGFPAFGVGYITEAWGPLDAPLVSNCSTTQSTGAGGEIMMALEPADGTAVPSAATVASCVNTSSQGVSETDIAVLLVILSLVAGGFFMRQLLGRA